MGVLNAIDQRRGNALKMRSLAAASCAVVLSTGCFYDFSLPPPDQAKAEPDSEQYCTPENLRVLLCDRFERTIAFVDTLHESFTASPSTQLEDNGRVLELNPERDEQEWIKAPSAERVSRAALAFRLHVIQAPRVDYRIVNSLKLPLADGSECHVYLRLRPNDKLVLADECRNPDGSTDTYEHPLPDLDGDSHFFRLELDLNSSDLSLTIDGVEQFPSGEVFPALARIAPGTPLSLFIGAGYAPKPAPGRELEAAVTLHIDDVLLAVL